MKIKIPVEYKLISDETPEGLSEKITDLIEMKNEAWEPSGSAFFASDYFFQAVTNYIYEDEIEP